MNNKKTVFRILSYAKEQKVYLVGALLCALVSVALTLVAPVLVGKAIDNIIGKGQVEFNNVFYILSVIVLTIVLSSLFQWLMGLCTYKISFKTVEKLREDVFKKYNNVPLSYIDRSVHGDLISRTVNDIDAIGDGLLQGITQLFSGVITIFGTLIFIISINYQIALIVVVITPVSLLVATFIAKLCAKQFKEQQQTQGELSGFINEIVGNQKISKAFLMEDINLEKFNEINNRLYECGHKAQFASSLANPSARFLNGIVYATVGIVGAISTVNGVLTVGQLSCFLTYANQYTKPFNEMTGILSQLQTAVAGAKRVFAVLDEKNQIDDKKSAREITQCSGKIDIENVYFSYVENQKLIENFNLHIKAGQRVAIVGPTGCGKTTLINLLMRFYEVTSGTIKVDDVDIKDITRTSLRKMYGMVLQESFLYSGTIKENIAYGKPDATMEEIIQASKNAFAHSFITQMKDGYDTVITHQGGNLSQGQKQLLCIARVMLSNPPMLILDEATSSIDTLTEKRVQVAFSKMMENKTSFVVAHRLSTIKESDIILVLNKGNIIEQGTHNELMSKNGFYYNLYNSQFAVNS